MFSLVLNSQAPTEPLTLPQHRQAARLVHYIADGGSALALRDRPRQSPAPPSRFGPAPRRIEGSCVGEKRGGSGAGWGPTRTVGRWDPYGGACCALLLRAPAAVAALSPAAHRGDLASGASSDLTATACEAAFLRDDSCCGLKCSSLTSVCCCTRRGFFPHFNA